MKRDFDDVLGWLSGLGDGLQTRYTGVRIPTLAPRFMVILVTLSEDVKQVIKQMILIDQILRKTSPLHKMSEEDGRIFAEAVARAEAILKSMKGNGGANE